jgi:hypothetical protein
VILVQVSPGSQRRPTDRLVTLVEGLLSEIDRLDRAAASRVEAVGRALRGLAVVPLSDEKRAGTEALEVRDAEQETPRLGDGVTIRLVPLADLEPIEEPCLERLAVGALHVDREADVNVVVAVDEVARERLRDRLPPPRLAVRFEC